jgi:hypothetical protein
MLGKLKIETATLICFAFIFRLLFVNVGVISSLNTNQNNSIIKRHFSTIIKKRRKNVDPINNSVIIGYSSFGILEEDNDNDDQFKLNPFTLLHVFYSRIECKIKNTLKRITPFNKYFSYKSSYRYIEYQVFRI